ncbi:hypothetical protein [Nocardia terpenica]|uniref:Ig-like domain-containing protein n=1 Tax=Nocardia terpenica TaxID=455432 RepID=A0A6G9Z8A0_9NOCA|nr:hypothetical protein [Nocardia terpenica]QIS21396.1 hypothetical protein F6W96_26720 [Nocardia terpenica]
MTLLISRAMNNSRFALAVALSAFTALSWVPLAGAANAAGMLSCTETGTVTWSPPGIGTLPSTVNWSDKISFSNCSGTAVDQGLPIPVSEEDQGTEIANCSGTVDAHTGTGTILWNDGTSSKVSSTAISQSKQNGTGPGNFPIRILTGNYRGKSATDSDTVTASDNPSGPCPGLTSATLDGTFTIAD